MNASHGSIAGLFVVDPHPLFIRGIRALAEESADLRWVGAASEPLQALEALRTGRPEVALVDASIAADFGLKRLRQLRGEGLPTRFIILANRLDQDLVFEAVREGLEGFLLKSVKPEELAESVRQVLQGQQSIDPRATEALLNRMRSKESDAPRRRLSLLSSQENRVLAKVCEGLTNKEIGEKLNLSEKTVKNYLSNVFEKLGMHRRSEAAAFYARHGSTTSASGGR